MGCENTAEQKPLTLEEQIRAANLGNLLDQCRFENELERQIFMAINMVRYAPRQFDQIVMQVKQSNRAAMEVNGTMQLRKCLQHQARLPPVRWDEQAALACRNTNEKVSDSDSPIDGGQLAIYKDNLSMEVEAEEFTQRSFNESDGANFIALQLILDWGRKGELGQKSPILDKRLSAVGISMVPSAYYQNITNILYVKGGKVAEGPRVTAKAVAPVAPVYASQAQVEDSTAAKVVQKDLSDLEKLGLLKLTLKHTHLIHNVGPPLVRIQPKLRIVLPNHQWESRWQEHGAEDLDWIDNVMEYEIRDLDALAHIEVINHNLPEDEPIGRCDVRIGDFCSDKLTHEFDLMFRDQNGGRVRFEAQWFPVEPEEVVYDDAFVGHNETAQSRALHEDLAPDNDIAQHILHDDQEDKPGLLKINVKAAIVEFHAGAPPEYMSLQVMIKHGEKVWRSEEKEHSGHEAHWQFARADFEVVDYESDILIEVRDAEAPHEEEPFAQHTCKIGFFARKGDDWEDWIPLKLLDRPAGRIHLKTDFIPQD